ncbi:MAG: alpha/beta hydrolase [Pseudomonadota bacterium]
MIAGAGADIFTRIGGDPSAPPVLLLHGYPQTSAMWDRIAVDLAQDFRVVCTDLRGYGQSEKPKSAPDHAPYSKRAMAADMVAVMAALEHERFCVGAHDRGGRVAHRLGLDHVGVVQAMTILDIAPTREMYANTTDAFARAYWHWFYLIQEHPFPEQMIGLDPDAFWTKKCIGLGGGKHPFSKAAKAEYMEAFRKESVIHASCEDYRAAATIDIAHDDADEGRKLTMPLEVYWAKNGVVDRCFDPLALWRLRAERVSGEALPGSHYFAEETPEVFAQKFRAHFQKHV